MKASQLLAKVAEITSLQESLDVDMKDIKALKKAIDQVSKLHAKILKQVDGRSSYPKEISYAVEQVKGMGRDLEGRLIPDIASIESAFKNYDSSSKEIILIIAGDELTRKDAEDVISREEIALADRGASNYLGLAVRSQMAASGFKDDPNKILKKLVKDIKKAIKTGKLLKL